MAKTKTTKNKTQKTNAKAAKTPKGFSNTEVMVLLLVTIYGDL